MDAKIIDFHTHILPRMDDGAENSSVSKEQLSALAAAGVGKVVLTPHFYPQRDTVEGFLERRKGCAERLTDVAGEDKDIRLYLGAEVLLCAGLDHMPGLERLCIEGTRVILLEMPFSSWNEQYFESVRKICDSGYKVVIAHIERYPLESALRLYAECPDVVFQLNGGAAELGCRKKLRAILGSLPVSAIGSDIHRSNGKSAKKLKKLSKVLAKKGYSVFEKTDDLLSGAVPV